MSIKNREEKENAILEAVGRIFLRDGYSGIGINSIAAEAGCNKVLIYRYFGGLEGVLEQFAQEFSLITIPEAKERSLEKNAEKIFHDQICRLRSTPLLREIMKWELVDKNPLTELMAEERETSGMALLDSLKGDSDLDVHALAAVISAGISQLAIRADTVSHYCGIHINTDEGWERIEKSISSIIRNLNK